jgi:hypothetical protein
LANQLGGRLVDGDALARGRAPDPLGGDPCGQAVAFHQYARGLLHRLPPFPVLVGLATLLLVGPGGRQQLGKAAAAWATCSSSCGLRWVLRTSSSMA